ncbi:MAG TPA: peptidoglycan DD-metalloendopeptidase family protein [Candidatus Acidoferrales bacterium]|nr:peptidoglycan DD-metalloendopeptidase family protein [Candidatus Acidoferrales bacterium]
MLNASVAARRVRESVARTRVSVERRLIAHTPRTTVASPRRTALASTERRTSRALAAGAIGLRRRLVSLATERRGAPLLAIVLLAVASLLSQFSGVAAGGTGGTDGPGTAYNPRIVSINVNGPDFGQVDPSLSLQTTSSAPGTDGAGPTAGTYAMVDGSLIKPITADANVADISGQVRTYTVRSGDTLSGIASRFGLSLMSIWWANRLTSADTLHIGQRLQIPPVDGVLYTVKAGDSVTSIARKYHATAADIRAFNSLTGDTVVIGQEIMVPDGHGAPIPTAAPAPAPPQLASVSSPGSGANGPVGGACTSCSYSGSMLWPVPGGFISQYYWWGHPALDIAAAYGTPVLAAAAGVVTYAGWRDNGGGYQVWISHGNNIYTTYNHMSAVMVAVGQHVDRGTQVGRVGATGDATGPHCHFEVWIGPIWDGGTRVNPLNYLSH